MKYNLYNDITKYQIDTLNFTKRCEKLYNSRK